ncbi:MAG: hypothetical protein HWN66_01440 [Candidatus Helarchaeota archaeon]|nr:hypothetical protein [Candidatus Helarchaeota archaeon]
MPKEYEEDRATKAILLTLESSKKPMKTEEIQKVLDEIDCPDIPPLLLNKLRLRGVIKGKLDLKQKAWLWWIE